MRGLVHPQSQVAQMPAVKLRYHMLPLLSRLPLGPPLCPPFRGDGDRLPHNRPHSPQTDEENKEPKKPANNGNKADQGDDDDSHY